MELFNEKIVKCADCKSNFDLSAGEQAFFAKKGLSEPKRCKACRKKRKEEREKEPL